MSLTLGTGPFGHHPSGSLNSRIEGPKHVLYLDDFPRRVRGIIGGETVVDTVRGKLLYESSLPPVLYVPVEDVRPDLIERTDRSTHCPFKGDASYWTIRAGDRVADNAIWGYEHPIDSAPWLLGLVAPQWDAFDEWFEEDERVLGKLRDPFHRVDVRPAAARVTVTAGGEEIARSDNAKLVFETGLPPRAYLPPEDVREGVLAETGTTSVCPYKGVARYWSVTAGGKTFADGAWAYEQPQPESAPAKGLISFLGDGIDVAVDRT